MFFIDGDLTLRRFRREDRDALVTLGNNPSVSRFLTDRFPHPYRQKDAEAWLATVESEARICNFAIEWREQLAGGIGLIPLADIHSGTADIGYWLGEPFWRKGIATRAVAALLPYALTELLFIRLQALVFADNRASMRVLEKNGFTREGILRKHVRKNGVVSDAVLYALTR